MLGNLIRRKRTYNVTEKVAPRNTFRVDETTEANIRSIPARHDEPTLPRKEFPPLKERVIITGILHKVWLLTSDIGL